MNSMKTSIRGGGGEESGMAQYTNTHTHTVLRNHTIIVQYGDCGLGLEEGDGILVMRETCQLSCEGFRVLQSWVINDSDGDLMLCCRRSKCQ